MKIRGRGRLAWLAVTAAVSQLIVLTASPAPAETRWVPGITVAERYDSNVYFFAQGQNLEDFVTTVTPSIRMLHRGPQVDVTAQFAMTGEYYLKNPGLNYFFPNGGVTADLSRWVGQWNRRLKLQVGDNFSYTPRPPAFVAPSPDPAIVPPQPGAQTALTQSDFVRGIQSIRANSFMNAATIRGEYSVTPQTSIVGNYLNQYMRFGNAFATTAAARFFTTMYQTVNVGPQYQVTSRDTALLTGQYQHIHFSQSGQDSTFQVYGLTAGWKRIFTKSLSMTVNAGVVTFSPAGGIQYLANGALTYSQPNSTTVLSYSRQVFPSFFIAAVPLVSDVVAATTTYRFTTNWSVGGALNYAHNSAVSGPPLSFISYGATANTNYQFTRTLNLTASYAYTSFESDFPGSSYSFNRHVVSIMLSKQWQ
jgi:hypothetical protein